MSVKVTAKTPGGKTLEFEVPETTTVGALREKIRAEMERSAEGGQTGVGLMNFRMISKGKVLSEEEEMIGKSAVAGKVGLLLMKVAGGGGGGGGGETVGVEEERVQCLGGCGFFGSKGTRGFCSKCYRLELEKEEKEEERRKEEAMKAVERKAREILEPEEEQEDKTKCWRCTKKIGLLGVQCRCGYFFCSEHRYAESHACEYDYKSNERRKLKKQNPVVTATKLNPTN